MCAHDIKWFTVKDIDEPDIQLEPTSSNSTGKERKGETNQRRKGNIKRILTVKWYFTEHAYAFECSPLFILTLEHLTH